MSNHIDIEGIFRLNRVAVDGYVNCSVEDWNNIVTYISDLEERERNIKAEAVDGYHKELLTSTKFLFHPHLEGVKAVWENKLKRGDL